MAQIAGDSVVRFGSVFRENVLNLENVSAWNSGDETNSIDQSNGDEVETG